MKNIFQFLSFTLLFCLAACKEQPVLIPDPSLNVTGKTVLVEEVTGVRCQNCPIGSQTLVALQQQLGGDKLVVVSIHASGNFAVPFSSSQYDFRSAEIQELANYVGPLIGYPTASIDRKLLSGEASAFISPHSRWGGEVSQDLLQDPSLAISIKNAFDEATRSLDIQVDILPDQVLTGEHRLTVLITQDSIVDPQIDGATLIPNYVHRHVLRDVVSAPSGDILPTPLSTGLLVTKSFKVTLPQDFDIQHCSVVAYVHRGGNPDKEVIQVTEKHVQE